MKRCNVVSDELPFKKPIDFTVENLRKLAPALARVEVGVIAADGSLKGTLQPH
jgi:hypothetical protein